MTFEIRVRKREVKAIEKEMIAIQKKFLGSDDQNKENEWLKYIYLHVRAKLPSLRWAYANALTLVD